MEEAIKLLKEHGYEAFELSGILTIPVSSVEDIVPTISAVEKIFAQCGYNKSWCVDPYYYDRHASLTSAMFDVN